MVVRSSVRQALSGSAIRLSLMSSVNPALTFGERITFSILTLVLISPRGESWP